MSWMQDIQKAVDYIEANLLNEMDANNVADGIHSSKDHFQKMFNIITGYTVGEYIRNRRLSLAAQEIAETNAKIIDISLKYMYESPESFTKAFTRLYGFAPSAIRTNGIAPDHFHPLTIQTILKGGFNMSKTIDVGLATLIPGENRTEGLCHEGKGTQKFDASGSELVLTADGDIECVQTAESYTLPLRIDLTAKTDSTNIRMYYHAGEVIFNWECNPDELRVHDILLGTNYGYEKGNIPINEYVDITWVIEKRFMEIYVNGELRHKHDSYPYMGMLILEPNREICAPVKISAAWGSTVTVKSLKVTEL